MLRLASATACCAWALGLFACATTSASKWEAPTVVTFSFEALSPETVHIPANGNLSWVSTATDVSGVVVFPASIAASFSCGERLEPYFQKVPAGYQSLPITSDQTGQSSRVQLPCPLRPGSYSYEVWIRGTGFGETYAPKVQQKLRGRIVVE